MLKLILFTLVVLFHSSDGESPFQDQDTINYKVVKLGSLLFRQKFGEPCSPRVNQLKHQLIEATALGKMYPGQYYANLKIVQLGEQILDIGKPDCDSTKFLACDKVSQTCRCEALFGVGKSSLNGENSKINYIIRNQSCYIQSGSGCITYDDPENVNQITSRCLPGSQCLTNSNQWVCSKDNFVDEFLKFGVYGTDFPLTKAELKARLMKAIDAGQICTCQPKYLEQEQTSSFLIEREKRSVGDEQGAKFMGNIQEIYDYLQPKNKLFR